MHRGARKSTNMDDEPVEAADVVEAEIAEGERDDVLEDSPLSRKEETAELRSFAVPRIVKRDASVAEAAKFASARIEELARPPKQRVLMTLLQKASILSPTHVENLTRLIETESCITPEEAARILRRKKRRMERAKVRLSSRAEEPTMEVARKLNAVTMLDKDAMLFQYLLAERFVRSLLQGQPSTAQREDFRDVAQVILRRLSVMTEYAGVEDGEDRATQQLRLLADAVANWIVEILIEVTKTQKMALDEYCKQRQMKMKEVGPEEDVDTTDSAEIEDWKLMEWRKQKKKKRMAKKRQVRKKVKDMVDEGIQMEEEEDREQPKEEDVEEKITTEELRTEDAPMEETEGKAAEAVEVTETEGEVEGEETEE